MKNGFRVPPAQSKKEAMRGLETQVANLEMAGRISQMMTKQLMDSVKGMSQDLNSSATQLIELQYKFKALLQLSKVDTSAMQTLVDQMRLEDFNEAAAKEDVLQNLVSAEEVGADSTITLTSTATDTDGNDRGIFRSRVKLSESGVPDLIAALQGKRVGDKVQTKLNGLDHTVQVLTISNPAPEVAAQLTAVPTTTAHEASV